MHTAASLFAITYRDGTEDQTHTFELLRDLSEAELSAIKSSRALVTSLVMDSAEIFRVQAAHGRFSEAIERQVAAMSTDLDQGRSHFVEVSTQFGNWLVAVRAFADRTSRWISKEYGQDSDAYIEFRRTLSEEWDLNAGYRLATALRNTVAHAGDVLNHCRVNATALSDWSSHHELIVGINGVELVERDGASMNAAVRKELGSSPGTIHAVHLASHASNACVRAHARLVDSLRSEIASARDVLDELVTEAEAGGGGFAGVANLVTPDDSASGRTFSFRDLEHFSRQNVEAIDRHLSQLPAIHASADQRACLDDLMKSPELISETARPGR